MTAVPALALDTTDEVDASDDDDDDDEDDDDDAVVAAVVHDGIGSEVAKDENDMDDS